MGRGFPYPAGCTKVDCYLLSSAETGVSQPSWFENGVDGSRAYREVRHLTEPLPYRTITLVIKDSS